MARTGNQTAQNGNGDAIFSGKSELTSKRKNVV